MLEINQSKLNKEITDKYSIVSNSFVLPVKNDWKDKISTEIGDTKQTDFYPQVKIKRWDNECNLSYRLIDNEKGTPKITTENDKIIWEKGNIKSHFYEVSISEEHPEGGYEFDIWLKEKPKTNKIEFSLNTKGLDFFYQPPLTQEYKNGYSEEFKEEVVVSETQVKDLDGNILVNRPENVVGSYAVYASENKINYIGGKEYKAGKIGHIYRPKIIDSTGIEVWGNLNIDNGVLGIEIPKNFLDKAVYPIIIDPTFGYETAGASNTSLANTAVKFASIVDTYTATTGDVVWQFSLYGNSASGTNNLYLTPYTFVTGNPSVPVDTTGLLISLSTTASWQSSATGSLSLSNGVAYCSAVRFNSCAANTVLYYDAGSAPGRFNSDSTTFTNPFSVSGTDSGRHYSLFARYRPSSGTVTETYNTTGTYSWLCPTGVTSVNVACWGGGSGGGGSVNAGGGGAYAATNNIAVTPGNSYTIVIPVPSSNDGGNVTFNGTTVVADGGTTAFGGDGVGGTVANSTGDTKYAGGNAGTKVGSYYGGGGGAAGPDGAGVNGQNGQASAGGNGGAGDNGSGGAGGNGGSSTGSPGVANAKGGGGGGGGGSTGGAGAIPGGAGGGGGSTPGNGANGACTITYTISTASGPAKLKTWNGLSNTKIKTINSLDISKVKTINGLV